MDKYYLDINLRRWALIQYGNHVWRRPEMKEHLAKTSFLTRSLSTSSGVFRHIIPPKLHEELNALMLHPQLKTELKFVVGFMATRISAWLHTVSDPTDTPHASKKRYVSYIDHVQWSHLGCIDISKTMKSLYGSRLLPMNYHTWVMLCENSVEECIMDFWAKISNSEEHTELLRKICSIDHENQDEYLIHYWRHRMQNQLEIFVESMDDFNDQFTIDQNMFVKQGYPQKFMYFWNRLNDDQKKAALVLLDYDGIYYSQDDHILCSWSEDINYLMFTIQQYSRYGSEEVLLQMRKSPSILAKMLVWPCHDNFIPALKESLSLQGHLDWRNIILELLHLVFEEQAYLGDNSRAMKWFCHLWNSKDIGDFRGAMLSEDAIFLIFLFKGQDILKYILIHQESWWEKKKLLQYVLRQAAGYQFIFKFFLKFKHEIFLKDHERLWLSSCEKRLREGGILTNDSSNMDPFGWGE